MKFAIAEIRRTKGRFVSITAAISLIVFLVLILAALADGLWYGSTGAIRNTGGEVFTFAADGRKSFIRSQLSAADVARVRGVGGVAAAGGVGALLGTGKGPEGDLDIALFGVEAERPGGPQSVTSGRMLSPQDTTSAVADEAFKTSGLKIGDNVTFSGSSIPMTIVGFSKDTRYQLQPTLWIPLETWRMVRDQARPELRGHDELVNVIAVAVEPGVEPGALASRIDTALGNTQSLTQLETILALPGTEQQRSTFNSIVFVTFVVAGVVITLFFALITLEKRNLLAMMKAIGTSTRYLASGALLQALICCLAGVVFGEMLAQAIQLILPSKIPAVFLPKTALILAIATVFTGLTGAALSLRRIARIDPATSLGGAL